MRKALGLVAWFSSQDDHRKVDVALGQINVFFLDYLGDVLNQSAISFSCLKPKARHSPRAEKYKDLGRKDRSGLIHPSLPPCFRCHVSPDARNYTMHISNEAPDSTHPLLFFASMNEMKCPGTSSRSTGTADCPACAPAVWAVSKNVASSRDFARSSASRQPWNCKHNRSRGCSRDRDNVSALNFARCESGSRAYGPEEGRLSRACSKPIEPQAFPIYDYHQSA